MMALSKKMMADFEVEREKMRADFEHSQKAFAILDRDIQVFCDQVCGLNR